VLYRVKLTSRTVVTAVLCGLAIAPASAIAQEEASTAQDTAATGGASPEAQPQPQSATPTTNPAPAGGAAVRTLKPGMRGRRVRSLQRRLGLPADGIYGRGTKRAVKRFQRRRGLKVDGVAGPATLRALGLVPKAASNRFVPSKNPPAQVTLPDSIPADAMATLQKIAECESGGDPTAVSSTGQYRGKYQFDADTWAAVGGSGDPAAAPEGEQDKRAYVLYDRRGTDPWPVCGKGADQSSS